MTNSAVQSICAACIVVASIVYLAVASIFKFDPSGWVIFFAVVAGLLV